MTSSSNGQGNSGQGNRLDRIEAALEVLANLQAASDHRIDRLAERVEGNSQAIADLTVQVAEANRLATNAITGLVDVADDILGRIDIMQSEIRGLQTENRRILEILERRQDQG